MSDGAKKPQLVTLSNPISDNWMLDRFLQSEPGVPLSMQALWEQTDAYINSVWLEELSKKDRKEMCKYLFGEWLDVKGLK